MFRGDDDWEQRPAFFAVSKYNLARSDLVPLIVTHPEDHELVYSARERGGGRGGERQGRAWGPWRGRREWGVWGSGLGLHTHPWRVFQESASLLLCVV